MVFSYRNKTAYGNNTNFFKHMTYLYKKLYICDYFTINSKAAKLEYLSPQNLVNSTTGPLLDIYTKRPIVYISNPRYKNFYFMMGRFYSPNKKYYLPKK